uniref:SPIN-DOC-like zinc-finger domain-containing protein n=1 Tax=Dicentrarchus labrax TaxID=13489 RepID=A0A8P4GNU0_DICLA
YDKSLSIDSENRQFNNEWTEKYAFIAVDANPVCLICNECLAVCKYNLRRHFKTTHANFYATFPRGSAARRQKITGLTSCYEQRHHILFRACTDQERATTASLRVEWILGKKKKPFTDSETVKECMLASIEEVVTDDKSRKNIIDWIKQIPISDTSNMRRVESLASDVFKTLLDKLWKAEVMSLAVDESTDNKQLGFGARQHAGDGWSVTPQVRSLHCLIHQSLLCAKLSGELKETMDSVMAIINFIRCTSSLQHRLFRKLLTDMSSEYKDLLIHNDIRWLSKGNALKRVCELREEILVFLRSSKLKKFLSLMENYEFNAAVCFLSDVFHHLNQLNMELKLSLFSADLCPGKMLHFPTHANYRGDVRSWYRHWMRGLYNWNSLTFSRQMTCDSHCSRQVLKNSGPMKLDERNFHIALFLLTMFGSTYTCELSFSHMNAIKTHNRISLTHQHRQWTKVSTVVVHVWIYGAVYIIFFRRKKV